jgi:hypothetical protein
MIGFPQLAAAQIILLVLSLIWFLRRNDEVPLLISGVLLYCSAYRFWVVTHGWDQWITVWQYDFQAVAENKALEVLGYIVLGQAILVGTYMYRQKHILMYASSNETPELLRWLRPRVILLSLASFGLVIFSRVLAESELLRNRSVLETSSYLLLFPFALIGISILNISLWKAGGYHLLIHKVVAGLILGSVAYLTFVPNMRFQFLGWIAGAAIIIAANYTRKYRLIILGAAAVIGIATFALAGTMRGDEFKVDEGGNPVLDRFVSANDANMLDGFVMLEQVYPDRLDYTWGGDHLDILLRPIPRSIWPDKPVGGYVNKLGLNDYDVGTTGISPSLFGSFYAEGGIVGIVILSIIYGVGLAAIMSYTMRLRPFASLIVRAVVCGSLVPMLRGGDLAGGYAWIGMAYWPCFLLLWFKRNSVRAESATVARARPRLKFRLN